MKPYRELWWPRFWPFLRVVDDLPATKRGRRKASNYGVSIVIRRDVLRDEPWVLQQEIYECRYWLRHPWRLMHWIWFAQGIRSQKWREENPNAYKRAAAHLSRVECASRAQEIRAKARALGITQGLMFVLNEKGMWIDPWTAGQARDYARSIHGAKNYPFLAAAGWTEDDCYNEIVKHL